MNTHYRLSSFNISNCSEFEIDAIFKLNQQNTPEVGSLESIEHLKKLIELSAYNLLMLHDQEIVGFIICMREGSIYESENYKSLDIDRKRIRCNPKKKINYPVS